MEEQYYSIVAAYERNGVLWYYRLADYDTSLNKFVEATYNTDNEQYMYEPVSLYSRDLKEQYKAILKKWKYDKFDDTKQYLQDSDLKGKVYEIVYLDDEIEFTEYDEKKVRDILGNGFNVPKQVNNEFLLVVGKTNKSLVVLLCNKKNFKKKGINQLDMYDHLYIDRNDRNLEHNIVSFDLYQIDRYSIISIENLLNHPFSKSIDILERYFYSELKLPKNKFKFLVREIDDYCLSFFSRYFKDVKGIYDLSNKERNKFLEVIKSISEAKNYIGQFEEKTGYSTEDLYDEFIDVSQEVIGILSYDDEMGQILMNSLMENQEYYNKCFDNVKKEWEESDEFVFIKEKRELELMELVNQIDQAELELQRNNKKIQILKQEYEENIVSIKEQHNNLLNECEDLKLKKEATINEINKSLCEYRNNLVSLIKETVPMELVKPSLNDGPINKGYSHIKNKTLDVKQYEMESYLDVFDFYVDNLSMYYTRRKSNDLSAQVFSAIANFKSIIVDESFGDILANCLAMIIDGKKVDKYSVFSVDVDANRLFCSIAKNSNKVIYIDGVLNSYNEAVFKQLVKGFPSKIFVFGIDEENITILSKGVWKFACYIDVNEEYTGYHKEEPLYSTYDVKLLRKELIKLNGKLLDKKLKHSNLLKDSTMITCYLLLKVYSDLLDCQELPIFYLNQIILNSNLPLEKLIENLLDLYGEDLINKSILSNELEM